jgi:hypothetical protein
MIGLAYDWLIIYCFTSHLRIFHLHGDVTITGEVLQYLGLCSALRAFEQGGIFIVSHLRWHRASVFPVSSEGTPHSVASYDSESILTRIIMGPHSVSSNDTEGDVETFSSNILYSYRYLNLLLEYTYAC